MIVLILHHAFIATQTAFSADFADTSYRDSKSVHLAEPRTEMLVTTQWYEDHMNEDTCMLIMQLWRALIKSGQSPSRLLRNADRGTFQIFETRSLFVMQLQLANSCFSPYLTCPYTKC